MDATLAYLVAAANQARRGNAVKAARLLQKASSSQRSLRLLALQASRTPRARVKASGDWPFALIASGEEMREEGPNRNTLRDVQESGFEDDLLDMGLTNDFDSLQGDDDGAMILSAKEDEDSEDSEDDGEDEDVKAADELEESEDDEDSSDVEASDDEDTDSDSDEEGGDDEKKTEKARRIAAALQNLRVLSAAAKKKKKKK